MKQYIKLVIHIPDELQEFLISELDHMDFSGFEQYDDQLTGYVPESNFNDVNREFIESWLAGREEDCYIIEESRLEETNWNETWEQSIKAQTIGRFYVKPTWSSEEVPKDSILLEIDPKMAFGTGYHETTRLVLRLLPECIEKGDSVLDVGTGTGILAIASLKLDAKEAVGIDIDEWSFTNAAENSYINEVADRLTISQGSLEVLPAGKTWDVVLANINRNTLLSLADQLVSHTGSRLILSGLMKEDVDDILRHPALSTLTLVETTTENEWVALYFSRPGKDRRPETEDRGSVISSNAGTPD